MMYTKQFITDTLIVRKTKIELEVAGPFLQTMPLKCSSLSFNTVISA